jgi:hypothetical protein
MGSAVTRLYTYIPLDFDQALMDGRLRAFDYALGCHLACESYRDLNTNRGIVTAYVSALADVFEVESSTIRRALRRLKAAGWIDFPEPDERQRVALADHPDKARTASADQRNCGTVCGATSAARAADNCGRGRATKRRRLASGAGFRCIASASLARTRKRNETKRGKPLQ